MRKRVGLYLYIFLALISFHLSGCPREWYFKITDVTDPKHPHFRVSLSKFFTVRGVGFAGFEIIQVNEKNEPVKVMWFMQAVENEDLNEVVYGTVPRGYKERTPAHPLELDKFYSVNGKYYFRLSRDQDKITSQVYDYRQFYEQFVWPARSREQVKTQGDIDPVGE